MDPYVVGGLVGLGLAVAGIVASVVMGVRLNWGRKAGERR